jgi:hypothetical protein
MTAPANCKNVAVLLQDVTIPDGTNIAYGARFTKTWQFRNTGTCPWIGYKIAFASGDRMFAGHRPFRTPPQSDVNVSVELTARQPTGSTPVSLNCRMPPARLTIGIERTFWVKITVGNATVPTLGAPTNPVPTISGTLTSQKPPGSCTYTTSGSYPNEIVQLINKARSDAGLPALIVNAQLAAAAQAHSIDMACWPVESCRFRLAITRAAHRRLGRWIAHLRDLRRYGAYPECLHVLMNEPHTML